MSSTSFFPVTLVGGLFFASTALAQEPSTMAGCLHLSKEVGSALANTSEQSQNYSQARVAQRAGQAFCANGSYARGVASYEDALTDLGQAMSTAGQPRS